MPAEAVYMLLLTTYTWFHFGRTYRFISLVHYSWDILCVDAAKASTSCYADKDMSILRHSFEKLARNTDSFENRFVTAISRETL